MTISELGGRKFVLCSFILTLTFMLLLIKRIEADAYLKLTFSILGLYTGLNVYQKKTKVTEIDSLDNNEN